MPSSNNEEYWDLFFDEVNSHLESLTQQMQALELNPSSLNIIREIFRLVHTIKGMAATIGFNSVVKLCHKMEELFDFYRQNHQPVSSQIINCQIQATDGLFKILEYISSNGEDSSVCLILAESLCQSLQKELSNLQKPQDLESKPEKTIQIKVKFAQDCQMPGVRAFLATQALEKTGLLLQSNPPKDQFLDNGNLVKDGLTAVLCSDKPLSQIKEGLFRICDVIEVELKDALPEIESQAEEISEKIQEVREIYEKECPVYIIEKLTASQKEELLKAELKIFYVDLSLIEEAKSPEDQFCNLFNNIHDYLGQILQSEPSLDSLKNRQNLPKQNIHIKTTNNKCINEILDQEIIEFNARKQRSRLQFILAIKGDHKNILDFLSDACELHKVELKEMEFIDENKISSSDNLKGINEPENHKVQAENNSPPLEDIINITKQNDIKTSFVRVSLNSLDALMNSVGELVINHNRLKLILDETPNNQLRSIIQYLNQVTTKIQQLVMGVRMVPISQVFNRFPRFIRDISRELKKDINLVLEGEETEIDRLMLDELNDILIHLIRNSMDHGLETTDERLKKGKSKQGQIKMQAHSQGNHVFITISDDGKGIDAEVVKRKALAKGLISEDEANLLSNKEIINLIFSSGFSTAETVSNLSGRGVGMDVVKSKINSLGGQITLHSVVGEGTSLKLSIPSTISIIQALIINIQDGLYTIPLSEIREIISVEKKKQIYRIGNCDLLTFAGQSIPLINLRKYLCIDESLNINDLDYIPDHCLVITINSEDKVYGLIVESLVGQQEVVIKPISQKANLKGLINGVTVFGDGRVAMILSIDQIVRFYLNNEDLRHFGDSDNNIDELSHSREIN